MLLSPYLDLMYSHGCAMHAAHSTRFTCCLNIFLCGLLSDYFGLLFLFVIIILNPQSTKLQVVKMKIKKEINTEMALILAGHHY